MRCNLIRQDQGGGLEVREDEDIHCRCQSPFDHPHRPSQHLVGVISVSRCSAYNDEVVTLLSDLALVAEDQEILEYVTAELERKRLSNPT